MSTVVMQQQPPHQQVPSTPLIFDFGEAAIKHASSVRSIDSSSSSKSIQYPGMRINLARMSSSPILANSFTSTGLATTPASADQINTLLSNLTLQHYQQQQQQQQQNQQVFGGSTTGSSLTILTTPSSPQQHSPQQQSQRPQHRLLERTHSAPASSTLSSSSSNSQISLALSAAANVNTSRYKTELCRPFEEFGTCKYGDKCQFAHGYAELRSLARHPKYKTELCRTYHTVGFCPYGPRCHFVHNQDEVNLLIKTTPTPLHQPQRRPTLCLDSSPSPPCSSSSLSQSPTSSLGSFFSSDSELCSTPPVSSLLISHSSPGCSPEQRLPVFNRISTAQLVSI